MSKNKDEEIQETETCPLCAEEFESDDLEFKPCKCGYQVSINFLKKDLCLLLP